MGRTVPTLAAVNERREALRAELSAARRELAAAQFLAALDHYDGKAAPAPLDAALAAIPRLEATLSGYDRLAANAEYADLDERSAEHERRLAELEQQIPGLDAAHQAAFQADPPLVEGTRQVDLETYDQRVEEARVALQTAQTQRSRSYEAIAAARERQRTLENQHGPIRPELIPA